MKLLQVCNVGNICGGTAACAWTIARALPGWQHEIRCLSSISAETREAFAPWGIEKVDRIDAKLLRQSRPDVLLLHNVHRGDRDFPGDCLSIQYHHSLGPRLTADLHVSCSKWLADQLGFRVPVLYQPVTIPPAPTDSDRRRFEEEMIVGRICTPIAGKWPEQLIPFYRGLSLRLPDVRWEFVGVPTGLVPALHEACRGRVDFHQAGWRARQHLRKWHVLLYHHPTLSESFGRTVAEAMRAGCVPIVDNRGGFREQFLSGESGFLCDTFEAFVQALEEVRSPAKRWRMAGAARELAHERFSLRAFARNFHELLLKATAVTTTSPEQ